jgi:hypothetical protein
MSNLLSDSEKIFVNLKPSPEMQSYFSTKVYVQLTDGNADMPCVTNCQE